ncbi:MAG: transcription antitermination factor NusB [Oscillospiraceae bacterium]|nr:transcription antitermination factor NusB [Oscillospiraceae bacterium]
MTRREERELAFILVFEKIFNDDLSVSEIIEIALDAELIENDNLFAISLAQMTDEHTTEFDSIISENAVGWRLERLPKVSVAILRLALCEMFYVESIPVKVSANEAVELAKKFGTKDDASFINGVLGKVIREKNLA